MISFIENKKICLIGNAKSIFNTEKDIDSYDVVCRMNRGYPKGSGKYIGSRTDVLFISTNPDIEQFKPKFIVWCTPRIKVLDLELKEKYKNIFSYYNIKDWEDLYDKLDKKYRPSTGLMAIDFLIKYTKFKELHIYGFDFFKTESWYDQTFMSGSHNPEFERRIINEFIKEKGNIKIIYE